MTQSELFGPQEGKPRHWPQIIEVSHCVKCGFGSLAYASPVGDLCSCCWAHWKGWAPPHDHPLGCRCVNGEPPARSRLGWASLIRGGLPKAGGVSEENHDPKS